jgi:hypothetical protein
MAPFLPLEGSRFLLFTFLLPVIMVNIAHFLRLILLTFGRADCV